MSFADASNLLTRFSNEVVMVLDRDGRVTQSAGAVERVLGYPAEAIEGSEPLQLIHPDDLGTARSLWRRTVDQPDIAGREELRFQHANGGWLLLEAVSRNRFEDPELSGVVLSLRDLDADTSGRSELTLLGGRREFADRLAVAVARAGRSGRSLAILRVGLDGHGEIAATHGSRVGDALALNAARRLRVALRPADALSRFADDSFAIICEDLVDHTEATQIGARVQRTLAEPFHVDGHELGADVVVGIATTPAGAPSTEVAEHAEEALVRAREQHQALAFDGPGTEASSSSTSTSSVRHALARDELAVWYQPIVDLRRGRICGVEALLRWAKPDPSQLPPADLVAVAEESDLILELGEWVLATALGQLNSCDTLADSAFGLSLNLSGHQLAQPGFCAVMQQMLATTGFDPSRLTLEITESVLVDSEEIGTEVLPALKAMGTHLAVDDFGTGYASLSYLRRFPVDELKIDTAFTSSLGSDDDDGSAIVEAVIGLAHRLDLLVTAEGIESPVHLRELRRLGCDHAQGFYLSHARPIDELVTLLHDDPVW